MNYEFDPKKVKECLDYLGPKVKSISKDRFIVLPYDQYKKFVFTYSKDSKSNLNIETGQAIGAGIVLDPNGYPDLKKNEVIFFPVMLGHKIHLNDKVDIHIKVLNFEDYLFKI